MTDTTALPPARVAALWRYPVKSLQGEAVEACEVGPYGLVGDRAFGLRDLGTGLVLTARRVPELLYARARWADGDVEITLPDGSVSAGDDDLSAWLGRRVTLERAGELSVGTYEIEREDTGHWARWQGPAGVFHDSTRTRVSIIAAASLGDWEARRFRANVLLDGPPADGEVAYGGRALRVGTAVLDVVKRIDRCVVVTRPQPGIEADREVLRAVARERGAMLGVGAMVRDEGAMAVGDVVEVVG